MGYNAIKVKDRKVEKDPKLATRLQFPYLPLYRLSFHSLSFHCLSPTVQTSAVPFINLILYDDFSISNM